MNIFALSANPIEAAQLHCDKHVVKMILESVQMLMAAYYETEDEEFIERFSNNPNAYRLTHYNHPCTIWTRTSIDNWRWLLQLARSLNDEFVYRYEHDECHQHMSITKIEAIIQEFGEPNLPEIGLTEFAVAMPDDCVCDNPIESYRKYYRDHKSDIAVFSKRPIPDFMVK